MLSKLQRTRGVANKVASAMPMAQVQIANFGKYITLLKQIKAEARNGYNEKDKNPDS